MAASGYLFVFGTLAIIAILAGIGVWWGGVIGSLLFLVSAIGLMVWLYMIYNLIKAFGSDVP